MNCNKYKYCIDRIYLKYKYIEKVKSYKTEGFSEYLLDNVSLQVRKMVEYLLLAIGIIHQEPFLIAENYFEFNCSGKGLFGILRQINEDFFPFSADGQIILDQKVLHNMFEVSSHILHITNPFFHKSRQNIDRKMKKMFAFADMLITTLNNHKIKRYDGSVITYCRLQENVSSIKIEKLPKI